MSVDLTCRCQRDNFVSRDFNDLCFDCRGSGRRPPTLPEFDAVVADRDRLTKILGEAEGMLAEYHESIGRYVPDGISVLLAERDALRERGLRVSARERRTDLIKKPLNIVYRCPYPPCYFDADTKDEVYTHMDGCAHARAALDQEGRP